MKKLIAVFIGCLAITNFAFAVWPPSTMLEEEAAKPAQTNATEPELPRPRGLVDKLEDDERRLEKVLQDLQNDTKELKQNRDQTTDSKTPIKN